MLLVLWTMATRGIMNSPDCICYICSNYSIENKQRTISNFVEKVNFAYFVVKLGDQHRPWSSHKVCSVGGKELRQRFQGKELSFSFWIPMAWTELKNYINDYYFCSCDVKGFSLKNQNEIYYPNIQLAIRPVPHLPEVSVPSIPHSLDNILNYHEPGVLQR